jgi:hypothetical protein
MKNIKNIIGVVLFLGFIIFWGWCRESNTKRYNQKQDSLIREITALQIDNSRYEEYFLILWERDSNLAKNIFE